MCDIPVILNLHFRSRDSYISVMMSGRLVSAEGRGTDADTHLALLGVKIAGTGILGFYKRGYKRFYKRILAQADTKDHAEYRRGMYRIQTIQKTEAA